MSTAPTFLEQFFILRLAWMRPTFTVITSPVSAPDTVDRFMRAPVDASGGQVGVNAPAEVEDSDVFGVTNTVGDASANNITVFANSAGRLIEDWARPGQFFASVALKLAGQSIDWQFDVENNRWKII